MSGKTLPDTLKPRKVPTQSRARERVELILKTTRSILALEGVNGLTTVRIAEAAGIPVSSIYQYFPSKEAIYAALYTEYLQNLRAVLKRFEHPDWIALGWEKLFAELFKEIHQEETRDDITRELELAMTLYPNLNLLGDEHSELVTEQLASIMRKLGSTWRGKKLRRMARFIYAVNDGVWTYRAYHDPPKQELLRWELAAVFGALRYCFETK